MPRSLAEFVYTCFVLGLWVYYARRGPRLPRTLWLPTIWLLLLSSRPLSFWLGVSYSTGSQLEGNAFDRTIYVVIILAALAMLARRGFHWQPFVRRNWPIFLFYGYLLATLFWADYPFVVFKRWFKDVGSIAIILLLLTDEEPEVAIESVFARCACTLLPFSVLLIKYIPELGRSYTRGGGATYCGITLQKNSLGELVMVFAMVIFSWMLLAKDQQGRRWLARANWVNWLLLGMGGWLLNISDSKTATVCLALGLFILLSYKLPLLRTSPKVFLSLMLGLTLLLGILQGLFQISDQFLRLIGRDPTLTNRTQIWDAVKEHPVNPLFGEGYLMYWDVFKNIEIRGDTVELKTAHNGYLEIYLDGGWLGIGVLALMLAALAARVVREFLTGSPRGRLQLAFFVVMLAYNVSESVYARRSPLWFMFLLLYLDLPAYVWAPRRKEESLVPQRTSPGGPLTSVPQP